MAALTGEIPEKLVDRFGRHITFELDAKPVILRYMNSTGG